MTKLERKLKQRERRAIDAVNKSVDDLDEVYQGARRILWDVTLLGIGVVAGMYLSATRAHAATRVSIAPRCEYVGVITETAPEAPEPPTPINEVVTATMPDAEMVERVGEPHEEWVSLGRWKISHYCPCRKCSGEWGHRTSSGATCQEGVTAACAILPAGTRVKIEGYGERIVQDTGNGVRGEHLDLFYESHQLCNELGLKWREVWVLR